MSTKADMAIAFHDKGYNCAQAVACSFCQEFGVAEEEMFRIAEGFGLGMGSMWSTFRNDDDHRTGKQCRRTGKRQTDKR